jgi:general secretion pathway protein G
MKSTYQVARRLMMGFTIVELLVVMAILGVLAASIMPLGETLLKAQKERDLRQALWEIRSAIDEYKRAVDRGATPLAVGESGYPPSLKALVDGVADSRPSTKGQVLYYLRQIPRDPFAEPDLPAEQTWRLRSYASPPDKPAPGADVFDIRSSSDALAMDGTPYAKW